MRTFPVIALTAAGCVALFASGCNRETVQTSNGPATITRSDNDQTVTVQNSEGTAVMGKGAVDASKIGLPLYPGAKSDNTGYAASGKSGSGQVLVAKTEDAFDKVYDWYKSQMPSGSEKMHMTAASGSVAVFQVGKESDKQVKVVTITSGQNETSIMLSNSTKP